MKKYQKNQKSLDKRMRGGKKNSEETAFYGKMGGLEEKRGRQK